MKKLFLVPFIVSMVLTGCSSMQKSNIQQPLTARPEFKQPAPPTNGAIYNVNNPSSLLSFADPKPRSVGDVLTIKIVENTNASTNSNNSISRTSKTNAAIPSLTKIPGVGNLGLVGLDVEANSTNNFNSKGAASGKNIFTGTLTVTVIEVYPNGNLLVSGEKQIAIGNSTEYVRLSGVVDPKFLDRNNSVESTKVADARIEYQGEGQIADSTFMPWLSRIFMSVLPF